MEILKRASEQKPNTNKVRKTRFAVVRGTYRELSDTTIKTWEYWFPPTQFGPIKRADMSHHIKMPLSDKTVLDLEVLFRALDRPQDVKKLLSLELTGAWINEVRETPKGIIDSLGDRVGRYPAVRDGGCTWRGVFGDTNPPDDDHFLYILAENDNSTPRGAELLDTMAQAERELRASGVLKKKEHLMEFFKQPGGLIERDGQFHHNPYAENLQYLEPNYYLTRMVGKPLDHIRVYYCAQYGFVREGKPVHPEYVDAIHCSQTNLSPVSGIPIYIGLDFGLTPAAVFAQHMPNGRWIIIDELTSEDMGIKRFGELYLRPKMQGDYRGYEFKTSGDPAGDKRADTDETTPYQVLETLGIKAEPCYTNDPTIRRGAMEGPFTRMVDGKPGLIISPKCKMLRKGLAGRYYYRRVQVAGDERYHDEPVKNKYSHVVEAAEYALIGGGEGEALVLNKNKDRENIPKFRFRLNPGPHAWMGN